jgi:hypothetical protein
VDGRLYLRVGQRAAQEIGDPDAVVVSIAGACTVELCELFFFVAK